MKFLVVAMLLAVGASANAMLIDFTDEYWDVVNNKVSHYDALNGLELTAAGGRMTFNGGGGEAAGCAASTGGGLLACDGDGIGVNNDEVTVGNQSLTVDFDNPENVINIYLLDLFWNNREQEVAVITISGGDTLINGTPLVGGFIDTSVSANGVMSIKFTATGDQSDYAVAAIEVEVAEPASLALLGLGLLGLAFAKRRKR